MILICISLIAKGNHLVDFCKLLIHILCQFFIELFIFFLLIYTSPIHNLDPTPMSVTHQGMVVCFHLQKKGEDWFHKL